MREGVKQAHDGRQNMREDRFTKDFLVNDILLETENIYLLGFNQTSCVDSLAW